ncbi:hypothetical protein EXIGLDRAFT_311896 [Exidia glandulosa HHB12029]|uniref:Uncharacterized protein n=1 Tax=Exidia glandulosa HHB12029 TaxID=1314781 RepID=A0A165CZ42_EXIGL|nr:hypothetical protein EXIGLDRAFT_311896 [Exidia glandulosa HHB12029]
MVSAASATCLVTLMDDTWSGWSVFCHLATMTRLASLPIRTAARHSATLARAKSRLIPRNASCRSARSWSLRPGTSSSCLHYNGFRVPSGSTNITIRSKLRRLSLRVTSLELRFCTVSISTR